MEVSEGEGWEGECGECDFGVVCMFSRLVCHESTSNFERNNENMVGGKRDDSFNSFLFFFFSFAFSPQPTLYMPSPAAALFFHFELSFTRTHTHTEWHSNSALLFSFYVFFFALWLCVFCFVNFIYCFFWGGSGREGERGGRGCCVLI